MRKTHIAIATTIVLALGLSEAHSSNTTGSLLLQYCENHRAAAEFYITGVVDAYSVRKVYERLDDRFCPPEGVIYEQMIDVTCKWVKDNPKDRHLFAPKFIPRALSEAWPCSK